MNIPAPYTANTRLDGFDLAPRAGGPIGRPGIFKSLVAGDLTRQAGDPVGQPGLTNALLPGDTTLRPGQPAGQPGLSTTVRPGDFDRTAAQPANSAESEHEQLTKKTQQWVAQTFFGTLLKQMSDSPFKSELFSGGRGGEAFSSLYHQQLVERMAHAAGSKLVNGIVRRIEATKAEEKRSPAPVSKSDKNQQAGERMQNDSRAKAYERAGQRAKQQSSFNLAA